MKITTQKSFRSAAIIAFCVLGPAAAIAQQQSAIAGDSRSTQVSMASLDLSTPEGVSAARERLRGSAERLCTQVADELDLSHHANFVKCVDAALTSALKQMAGPTLAGTSRQSGKPGAALPVSAIGNKTVSFADLDLATPQGVQAAHQRLLEVANKVCSQVADELDLSHHSNYIKCVDDAMARAMPKIDALAAQTAPRHGLVSNIGK